MHIATGILPVFWTLDPWLVSHTQSKALLLFAMCAYRLYARRVDLAQLRCCDARALRYGDEG